MANYKNIVDVESVAEATESMNVLVEDAGSLKKVPAGGMLGGGNGNFCFIDGVESESIPKSSAAPSYTYSSTMTYDELVNLINNNELAGAIGRIHVNGDNKEAYYYPAYYIFHDTAANEILFNFGVYNGDSISLYYHSDGTINESSNSDEVAPL